MSDVDCAYEVVVLEARLSSGLQDSVADWSTQPACAARVDAGHKNGPGVARSPSSVQLVRVGIEKVGKSLPLWWHPCWYANLCDQRPDRMGDQDQIKVVKDVDRSFCDWGKLSLVRAGSFAAGTSQLRGLVENLCAEMQPWQVLVSAPKP